ncbi:MAG: exo-alpha-sialidase [Pirellulales bacterium]
MDSREVDGKMDEFVSVVDGKQADGSCHPCWNPVLQQMPSGLLYLFYKVGPSPDTWWGVVKASRDNGQTWSEAVRLPDGFCAPVKNKPILPDGNLPRSSTEHAGWHLHLELVDPAPKNWKKIVPAKNGCSPTSPRSSPWARTSSSCSLVLARSSKWSLPLPRTAANVSHHAD